jgi:hypothetical protein
MKKKTLLIATAMILTAAGSAFAQTSGDTPNTATGGSRSQPEAGSSSSAPTPKDSQNMEMQKNKSPASPNAGVSQEKWFQSKCTKAGRNVRPVSLSLVDRDRHYLRHDPPDTSALSASGSLSSG